LKGVKKKLMLLYPGQAWRRWFGKELDIIGDSLTKDTFKIIRRATLGVFQNIMEQGGADSVFVWGATGNKKSHFDGVDDKRSYIVAPFLGLVLGGRELNCLADLGSKQHTDNDSIIDLDDGQKGTGKDNSDSGGNNNRVGGGSLAGTDN